MFVSSSGSIVPPDDGINAPTRNNSSAGTSTLFEMIPNIKPKILWVFDPCTCCECCYGCHLKSWCICLAITQMVLWIPIMCIYLTAQKQIRRTSPRAAELLETKAFVGLLSTASILSVLSGIVLIIGAILRLKYMCIIHSTASVIIAIFLSAAFLDGAGEFPNSGLYLIVAPLLLVLVAFYLFLALASYGLFTRIRAEADHVHARLLNITSSSSHVNPQANKNTRLYAHRYSTSIYDGKYSYLGAQLFTDSD